MLRDLVIKLRYKFHVGKFSQNILDEKIVGGASISHGLNKLGFSDVVQELCIGSVDLIVDLL